MLGYSIGIPERESPYGLAEIGEQFWRSELQCEGDEESLEECGGKENPSCTRGEVAAVTCHLGFESGCIKQSEFKCSANNCAQAAQKSSHLNISVDILFR